MEKAEQDKKSAVIRAEGEAKSAQLLGEAIQTNPSFIILRRIEAAREIAQTLSNSANRVVLSSDSLLLNLVSPHHALNPAAAAHCSRASSTRASPWQCAGSLRPLPSLEPAACLPAPIRGMLSPIS